METWKMAIEHDALRTEQTLKILVKGIEDVVSNALFRKESDNTISYNEAMLHKSVEIDLDELIQRLAPNAFFNFEPSRVAGIILDIPVILRRKWEGHIVQISEKGMGLIIKPPWYYS
jgi:hypothetical protein